MTIKRIQILHYELATPTIFAFLRALLFLALRGDLLIPFSLNIKAGDVDLCPPVKGVIIPVFHWKKQTEEAEP